METVDHTAEGMPAPRKPQNGFAVSDDLAGRPVTDSELDAVEAFLSEALKDLLSSDSEPPQTSSLLMAKPQERGADQ